jgi:hypothetical protein
MSNEFVGGITQVGWLETIGLILALAVAIWLYFLINSKLNSKKEVKNGRTKN